MRNIYLSAHLSTQSTLLKNKKKRITLLNYLADGSNDKIRSLSFISVSSECRWKGNFVLNIFRNLRLLDGEESSSWLLPVMFPFHS